MLALLLASGAVYLVLGDPREAIGLLVAVFLVMGITLYQERRGQRAIEALRDLSSPRVLVVRDGVRVRVAGREVVPGDVMVLNEGDRVGADGVLFEALNLSVDESLLTGESVPVQKGADERAEAAAEALVHSGTLVVGGQGLARVSATGTHTRLGAIGRVLAAPDVRRSSLQEEISRVVRVSATVGLSLCAIMVVVFGLTRGHWLNGVLAGLTMAISMLPEEMPVVLTVFLALGAWRIARRRVLTRRVPAIEALGAASVLCVDKTGTLTMNRMDVAALAAGGALVDIGGDGGAALPEPVHALVEYSILASRRDAFDPMERAFAAMGERRLGGTEHLHADWTLVREYPLTPELPAIANVWQPEGDAGRVVAIKGAPEAVLALCGTTAPPDVHTLVQRMAERGLRVLAVGRARLAASAPLPDTPRVIGFDFVGLTGLADPVRPGVREAVRECLNAGVRVIMITGDHPVTARSVARQVGLARPDAVMTGAEVQDAPPDVLRQRIAGVHVFARVAPDQKLRLVRAFQSDGSIVAMTGDGVNDAPALRAADIGIAMGGRGTDVAREAADLVLLDDAFDAIVNAIRLGRRIYDNLANAMVYVLAIHIPIAALSLAPVLLGWPLLLMPMHVVLLEMVIDPACSIVFEVESEEQDVMRRPPRPPHARLFGPRLLGAGLLQGLSLTVVLLGIYVIATLRGQGEADARALTYATLVLGNVAFIFTNRSRTRSIPAMLRTPNRALWWVTAGAVGFLALVLYLPSARALFRFSMLHPLDIVLCLAGAAAGITAFEVLKLAGGRRGIAPAR